MYGHPTQGYLPHYKPRASQRIAAHIRSISHVVRSLLERLQPVSDVPPETGFFSALTTKRFFSEGGSSTLRKSGLPDFLTTKTKGF